MGKKYRVVRIVFLLLLVGVGSPLSAQLTRDQNLSRFDDRWIHFGFYLGVNTMDYRFTHYSNVYQNPVFAQVSGLDAIADNYYQGVHAFRVESFPPNPGFTVGGVVNLRMTDAVDFRFTPGMSLGTRNLVFSENISQYISDPTIGGTLYPTTTYERYLTTPSAYIDLPVGFRYKGQRLGNVRPYIYGGGAYRRDLENKRISESVVHLKRNGYYAEIAFGLDTYFPFFRLSSEFKFSYGLNNLIKHDADLASETPLPYYGYILEQLNSNIFTLVFYFE
jgi:hypothetical protein